MLAAANTKSTKAENLDLAGAFYLPIQTGTLTSSLTDLEKTSKTFNHKANGIFNGRFFDKLDKKTASKNSPYYNFSISAADGQYGNYRRSGAMKPDDFKAFLNFAESKIKDLAENITKGKIDIEPFQLGNDRPCRYCQYKPICRFDWQINDYNYLKPLDKIEFLNIVGDAR